MTQDWQQATDSQLLAACHAEEQAFVVFYRRHERLIAGWLMRRCGRVDLVGDLVAEVFAAAYLSAPRFRDGPEPAQAWLLGIARNKLLWSLRRERAQESARHRLQMEAVTLSDHSLRALRELESLEATELLAGLPAQQREAIRARVLDEMDYRELAASLSITPEVARKRVSRGLRSLRKRLQQQGVGP